MRHLFIFLSYCEMLPKIWFKQDASIIENNICICNAAYELCSSDCCAETLSAVRRVSFVAC